MRPLRSGAAAIALSISLAPAAAARPLRAVGSITLSQTGGVGQVEVRNRVAAVNQRDDGVVALVDVQNPARPKVLARFDAAEEGGHAGTGGTPYDGDLAFSSDGNFLFYARQTSDYSEEGLHVLDVSDPAAPREVFYQPQGGMLRLAYHDDGDAEWVVTLDAIAGLVVSRFERTTGATVPVHVDALPALKVGGPASAGIAIEEDEDRTLMYVTTGRTGLQVFDFTNPLMPEEIGSWPQIGLADIEVVREGKRRLVYAATEYWFDRTSNNVPPEVVVLDATDVGDIRRVGTLSLGRPAAPETRVQGIDAAGKLLYVAHSSEGVVVFDRRRGRVVTRHQASGGKNENAGVPGAPYALDAEVYGRLLYTTDGATGRLTILRR
jgi:hypothetical protein